MKKVLIVLGLITVVSPTLALQKGSPEYKELYQITFDEAINSGFTYSEAQCFAGCIASQATLSMVNDYVDESTADHMGYVCGLKCANK